MNSKKNNKPLNSPWPLPEVQNPIKVYKAKDLFKGLTRDQFIEKLKAELTGKVEAAYIFGSIARGDYSSQSDVDIILVVYTTNDFFKRCLDFPQVYALAEDIDLLIYTPEEFKQIIEHRGQEGFWKKFQQESIRII